MSVNIRLTTFRATGRSERAQTMVFGHYLTILYLSIAQAPSNFKDVYGLLVDKLLNNALSSQQAVKQAVI